MFERYDEQARRAIFFARYESSQAGGSEITPVHLLLALLREESGLRTLLPAPVAGNIRAALERTPSVATKLGIELPVSQGTKRVLAFAAEWAERLNHYSIGTVHLLLGTLLEPSEAQDALTGAGITLDKAREFAASREVPPQDEKGQRDALHTLVDRLPPEMLGQVQMIVEQMELSKRMRRTGMERATPKTESHILDDRHANIGGRAGGWVGSGRRMARMSSNISETNSEFRRSFDGHDVALIERVTLSEDRKTLTYNLTLQGPKKEHHWSVDLDLP